MIFESNRFVFGVPKKAKIIIKFHVSRKWISQKKPTKRKQAEYYHWWYRVSHNDSSSFLPSLSNLYPQFNSAIPFLNLSLSLCSLFHSSMEVVFSSKPQSLTFNPCLPLNSSSSFSYSRLRFVRRQFLGCSHNLRPPDALRSRPRCRKLGLLVQSPRCIFRATLSSNPVLIVVAVLTFSAVSFIYVNFNRRKKNAVEVWLNNRFRLTSFLLFSCSQFGECFFFLFRCCIRKMNGHCQDSRE